ncbi:MAG TPA: SRPBCC family protein [Kofleriaceae bacterium]|nr:SRPBCC family protein [Kofleriaceae bacterium]
MSKKPTGHLRGNDLILTRSFKAPIADVWESVTKSERTERWYGKWEGDGKPGGEIRIKMVFEQGDHWSNATINTCEAPHHLELTTKGPYGSHLELKLREANGVTELEFTHHLKDRSGVADYGPGWEYYLDNLVAARDGLPLPKFEEYYPSQKEYYLAQTK